MNRSVVVLVTIGFGAAVFISAAIMTANAANQPKAVVSAPVTIPTTPSTNVLTASASSEERRAPAPPWVRDFRTFAAR